MRRLRRVKFLVLVMCVVLVFAASCGAGTGTDDTATASDSRIGAVATSARVARTDVKDYSVTPVDSTQVELHPGSWADRLEVNRTPSIPHGLRMLREDATDPTNSRIECFPLAVGLGVTSVFGFNHFLVLENL